MMMLSNGQKIALHKLFRKIAARIPLSGQPSIFIVGAQKAGTTSLHEYLCHHPQIAGGLLKELHFFNKDPRYNRGIPYYENNFKNFRIFNRGVKFLDATPEYMTDEKFLDRLHQYRPDARLIVVLREPIARAYSAWNFYTKLPQFKPSMYEFTKMIKDEIACLQSGETYMLAHLGIVKYGCYDFQIKGLFDRFAKEQISIFGSKDLSDNPAVVVRQIFKHVGVADIDPSPWIRRNRNTGKYSSMPQEAQKILQSFYEPSNERLKGLLGEIPNW
jgi:hypothetical protein